MTKELLKQALDALVAMQMEADARYCGLKITDDAITALRAAIAQPEQMPVEPEPRVPITGAQAAEFCVWLGPQLEENLDKYTLAARAFIAGKAAAQPESKAHE